MMPKGKTRIFYLRAYHTLITPKMAAVSSIQFIYSISFASSTWLIEKFSNPR